MEIEITNGLPIDKHGNIRDVKGERMCHVFDMKRGRRLLQKKLYQCDLFAHRNNKIFNQQRFIYISVTLKHFSIQTDVMNLSFFYTLSTPLNDCNSKSKQRGSEKMPYRAGHTGREGVETMMHIYIYIYITICLSICP